MVKKMKISKQMLNRLTAQAEEAEYLKLNKVSKNLQNIIKDASVRENEMLHSFSKDQLENNIENLLWKIALNVSDYFDSTPDAEQVQKLVDLYAAQLFNDFRVLAGSKDGVGAYEPVLPGEDIEIEIEL